MIDGKGRLFGKINVVDLLIIVLLVFAASATVYKFKFSAHSDVNDSNIKIEYVLKVRSVRNYTVDAIKKGTEIYDEESGDFLGVVSDVKSEEAMDYIGRNDGKIFYSEKPERYDVYITVESDARVIGGSFFANGKREINKYSNIAINAQNFSCTSEVQSVSLKK